MELVRGISLEDRLRQGPLPPHEAARIGRGVLGALRAAHEAGIHHRDVKPGNVLLRPDGSAVLTDFGIAALRDSTTLTATGEVIGSPEYIAPERLHGDETQTASDFWSLAMLLYVAVEGYHPMRRATTMATLAAVMTEQVPPPKRAGALTPALRAVLAHDPAVRPTGEQLDRMLVAAEHGAVVPPTPAGPAFPAQPSGPPTPARPAFPAQSSGPRHPAYQPPDPVSRPQSSPPSGRKRVVGVAAAYSVSFLVVVAAVAFLITKFLESNNDPSTPGGNTQGTQAEDLLTPAGARQAVSALSQAMGGTMVSKLTLYPDYASATAPAKNVTNGFDEFEYRDGVAIREGPDTVDADRAVLDLNTVNWDALPALWQRAETELGIDKPTTRYMIVDTDIIDDTPELKLYLSDDYGAAFLQANLAGEAVELFPRDG
jgi:serine/threonine protein kinase